MNDEPNANVDLKWLVKPEAFKYGYAAYSPTANTSGDIVQATYTNLKNSYIIDQYGNRHYISKIVRTFSDLKKEYSWGSKRTWHLFFQASGIPESEQFLPEGNDNTTFLVIGSDPSRGAEYCGANSISVADKYYDANGNLLDPTGGYYVVSSLNHTAQHIEEAGGENVSPITLIGSSVSVLSNGNLGSIADNIDAPGAPNSEWDHYSSPYFYWGAGLLKILNSNPKLTFSTHSDDSTKQSNDAFWFAINTKMPMAPVQHKTTTVHYHYNTSVINVQFPNNLEKLVFKNKKSAY